MKPSLLLFCLLLLCPFILKAQTNYKPGLVVTTTGDTLRGFIDYREWEYNPASVSFKTSAGAEAATSYSPSTIRYFEVAGVEAYQQYEGFISMNPVAIEKLSRDLSPPKQQVVVFLKISQKGAHINLLTYADQLKTRLFFQENDGSQPQELFFNRTYVSDKNAQIITQKGYAGQLQVLAYKYASTDASLKDKIEKARYLEGDMKKVFAAINKQNLKQVQEETGRSGSRFFAGVALQGSKVNISGIKSLEDASSNPVSFMPLIAVGYDLFLNRHVQKTIFRTEVGVTGGNYFVEKETGDAMDRTYSYRIAQQTAFISPQLIYNFYNTDRFKVYGGINIQLNLSRYTENVYSTSVAYSKLNPSASDQTTDYQEYKIVEPVWISYGVRAGALLNQKYELYARYSPNAVATNYSETAIGFSTFGLGMNYHFNK